MCKMANFNYKKIGIKAYYYVAGIALYAIGLKWFVYPANIIPAGLTGVSVLLQKIINNSMNVLVPVTVLNVACNLIPAGFSYKIVGKKFTAMSFIILFLFTFVADNIPPFELTKDPLISAIFGGILCGFGSSLWFRCGVSGGGTDFIAMSISNKYHIQTFGYIMGFNIVLIMIQGMLYGWDYAFYSIIYQYVTMQAINIGYRHYEARTLLIITNNPDAISKALIENTGHSSTRFEGIGGFTGSEKTMLYTVVTEPEMRLIINVIKKCDDKAFVNIIKSNEIQGNFNYLPVDRDVIDSNY